MIFVNERDLKWKDASTSNLKVKNILTNYNIMNGDVTCGLSKWPYGEAGKIHQHENLDEVYIVLRGEAKAYINGKYESLKPGDIVHAKAGEQHGTVEGTTEDGIEMFYVLFPTEKR